MSDEVDVDDAEARGKFYKEKGVFVDHPRNGPSTSYGRFYFPRYHYAEDEASGRPGMSGLGLPSGNASASVFQTPPLSKMTSLELAGLTVDPLDGWLALPSGIRFHPEDTTFFMYSRTVIREDPKTFVPDPSKYNARLGVTNWGIEERTKDYDLLASMLLCQGAQGALGIYGRDCKFNPTRQFINVLEHRKMDSIAGQQVQSALGQSFVIRIELCENEGDVWRRFRVPASIDLAKLHDQVIAPMMGWSRCDKAHVFEDPRDGTVLGIHASKGKYQSTMDSLVNASLEYYHIMDDRNIPLAIILRHIGDVCYYTYDLAEQWVHRLTVESIVQFDNNTCRGQASVYLIDGAGACPPEDGTGIVKGRGCLGYAAFLNAYKKNPKKPAVREALRKIKKAKNYKSEEGSQHTKFDPFTSFDLEKRRQILEEAIAGPSLRIKGAAGSTSIKERKIRDVCERCGDCLKVASRCSRCLGVSYCSRDCQTKDWKKHKVVCKKRSGRDDDQGN